MKHQCLYTCTYMFICVFPTNQIKSKKRKLLLESSL